MIGAPFISPLLQEMPQINKVYSFPRALLKQPLKLWKLKKTLNANAYDVLIAPSLSSSSDSLFTFLLKSNHKVGFYAPDIFSPLTHGVAFPRDIAHEALKPLALLSAFGEEAQNYPQILDLKLSPQEISQAKEGIPHPSIGIFRDARGNKKLDDKFWKALILALKAQNKNLHFIDILDPNNTQPLDKNMQTLSEKNLRVLASKIANLDAFICADTGPMHLSSASLTPTIALFKTTSPSLYGTLGKKDLSLVIKDKSIVQIAKELMQTLGLPNDK
jgi:ADP-heptose:LPS heptosyltransferase